MVSNGDIITGKYTIIGENKSERCVMHKQTQRFINIKDITNYEVILFKEPKDFDIYNLDVIEQLTDNKNTSDFNFNSFIENFKVYDMLLINQSMLIDLIYNSNCSNNYEVIVNDYIKIHKQLIKTYLIPKEINCAYFIKLDDDNNVESYKKIIP